MNALYNKYHSRLSKATLSDESYTPKDIDLLAEGLANQKNQDFAERFMQMIERKNNVSELIH